jgi:hypothetical protein
MGEPIAILADATALIGTSRRSLQPAPISLGAAYLAPEIYEAAAAAFEQLQRQPKIDTTVCLISLSTNGVQLTWEQCTNPPCPGPCKGFAP